MVVAAPSPSTAGILPVAHVRLFTDRLLVSSPTEEEELSLPVLCLSFDYGGTRIAAADERQRFFVHTGAGMLSVERDFQKEAAARRELERFGAVELGCLEDHEQSFGSTANYVVSVDPDSQAYCAFTAQALPALRELGFVVEVDADYPYQVIESDASWYVSLQPLAEKADWFDCELGVEIEGQRVNLLEALLGLLDSVAEGSDLDRVKRGSLTHWAFPIDDQHYVRVPGELLWGLFDVLRELYSGRRDGGRLELCRFHGSSVEALSGVLASSGANVRRYGERPVSAPRDPSRRPRLVGSFEAPEGLRATLRPYQAVGVAWMQRLRSAGLSGVLADDMGLGKTLQTIAHLCIEHARPEVTQPSLVVVPTSLIQNWRRELSNFAPHLRVAIWHGNDRRDGSSRLARANVVITTYGMLVREPELWERLAFHYLILDEAQAIKNPRAAARAAANAIAAEHRLCLSGTPVENHLGDLWSIFDFLLPGLLGDVARFQASYRTPIEREADEDRLAALRRIVSPFILRRTKNEVARDLPQKTVVVHPIALSGEQRRLYESIRIAAHADVRRVVKQKGIGSSTIAILDALMKLRQVCCDPRLVRVSSARNVQQSAKRDFFFRLLSGQLSEGRRVLVFSQFTSMLRILADGLAKRGIDALSLTGATRDRQAKVDAFERGLCDVFLISLKAGGTGLNLTSADTVIHYDPWWNPAAQAQATDRAHRIGQKRPVFVHQLIAMGSVEERMLELQRHKEQLSTGLVGSTGAADLSERDLDDLFAPLPS